MDVISLNFHALLMSFHHLLFVMLNLFCLDYEAIFAAGVTNVNSVFYITVLTCRASVFMCKIVVYCSFHPVLLLFFYPLSGY